MTEEKHDVIWLSDRTGDAYSSIRETRHAIVFPWLIRAILQRTPSSVLDYGAGDGFFLETLNQEFAGSLWYYDPSPHLVSLARARLRRTGVHICDSPQSIRGDSIDLIVSTAVWMTIATYDGCVQYLMSQRRILKPGGSALVAVTHPCFREETFSSFVTDFDNSRYLNNGAPFHVRIFDKNSDIEIADYHWNLSTMVKQSADAGFRLLSLWELPDIESGNKRGSTWLCFEFGRE